MIIGNKAGSGINDPGYAAGMCNSFCSPTVVNCFFSDNEAAYYGGGMYNVYSDAMVTNCVFTENAAYRGGGIYNGSSSSIFTNCTITANSATGEGSATGKGGGMSYTGPWRPTVTNCIFWANTADEYPQIQRHGWPAIFSYCDIQDCGESGQYWDSSLGTDGDNNIQDNPQFVNPGDPDGPDHTFGTADDGLRLKDISPCIDVADGHAAPSTDILGLGRVDVRDVDNDGFGDPDYADIGAYEFPPRIVVMCWIDESYYNGDFVTYYWDAELYDTHLAQYRDVIKSKKIHVVKSGCLVPNDTIEYVLPEGYFDPDPIPEYVNPDDPPEGISIYKFPRDYPDPTLGDFISHFDRICDGVVPEYLCLSVDNSGSMTTSTINPYFGDPELDYPYTKFKEWIEDNYPETVVNRRDGEDEFTNQAWIDEMRMQIQNVIDGL